MSVDVRIKKDLGNFGLDVAFASESRRIGILGASGSGKSLTLKCIAGIEHPDRGRIMIDDKLVCDTQAGIFLKPQLRKTGYLFQNYALFPFMTVARNIAAGLKGKKSEINRQVEYIIRRFQLQGLEHLRPCQLSGGQQQRVALARMFVCRPRIILLDEPFSALDVYLRDQMQREFMEMLPEYGGSMILVSHDRDEIYRMSEELLVLENGRIVRQGPTRELFRQPGNVATARLTGCKNIAGVTPGPAGGLYVDSWKITLPIRRGAGEGIHAVAIRAHQLSMQKTPENEHLCFPVLRPVVTEDMAEYNISFQTSEEASGRMDWKISRYLWQYGKDRLPQYLYLREQDLLLLERD